MALCIGHGCSLASASGRHKPFVWALNIITDSRIDRGKSSDEPIGLLLSWIESYPTLVGDRSPSTTIVFGSDCPAQRMFFCFKMAPMRRRSRPYIFHVRSLNLDFFHISSLFCTYRPRQAMITSKEEEDMPNQVLPTSAAHSSSLRGRSTMCRTPSLDQCDGRCQTGGSLAIWVRALCSPTFIFCYSMPDVSCTKNIYLIR